jgi:A/G-specific adenine glycosylase
MRVTLNGERVAMVDGNFVRMLRRVFAGPWMSDYRYDSRLQELARAIVQGATDPRHANWAVLDLGATICIPRRPRCSDCPLVDACLYATNQARDESLVHGLGES